MHGYEIEYVFGVPMYNSTAGYTFQERIFSEKVLKYWTNFASYGFDFSAYFPKCVHFEISHNLVLLLD